MIAHADRPAPVNGRGGPRPPAAGPGAAADRRAPVAGALHVLDGPDRGRVWRLSPGTHLLGRAVQCDLAVSDPEVSRFHCLVAVTADAGGRSVTVTVEDRGSGTGTVVDGAPAGRPSVLGPGARIIVGRTTLGWAPAGWNPAPAPPPVPGQPTAAPAAPPAQLRQQAPVLPAAPAPAPPPRQTPEPPTVRVSVPQPPAQPFPPAPVPAAGPPTQPTPQPWRRWLKSAAPARMTPKSMVLATLTSLAALGALAGAGALTHLPLLIPPLAASMALIAGGTALPLAQPRNVIGGQVVSALVGFAALALVGPGAWAAALAGALALGAMLVLRVSHSPAAATAVIVGATDPAVLPFMGLLVVAVVVLVAFGIVGARLDGKKYPVYWW
jgi:hypothetical protein